MINLRIVVEYTGADQPNAWLVNVDSGEKFDCDSWSVGFSSRLSPDYMSVIHEKHLTVQRGGTEVECSLEKIEVRYPSWSAFFGALT